MVSKHFLIDWMLIIITAYWEILHHIAKTVLTEDDSDLKIGDLGSQHVWQAKETSIAQRFKISSNVNSYSGT